MKDYLVRFWKDEEGLETIEILLILSVLIIIAVMFKDKITTWAEGLLEKVDKELKLGE
ncbi:Flp1 family type IVb pilin [Paucisalibacillus globulus]|uniref:Flp1 family type IVb pilin n=1 Tax=Paucisalibacillus globulus TaxID=351095 RepID=UPI000411469F|nr:Flp1 family type IVb pilin [Paucisalibacillus globulus]